MNPTLAPITPTVLDQLLRTMLGASNGISDLLFIAGKSAQAENMGQLQDMDVPPLSGPLSAEQTKQLAEVLMAGNARLHEDLQNLGGADTSYSVEGLARFRVNVFKQNGRHAIVMRKLSSEVPSLEALKLAPIFYEIIKEKTGIVLVTGGTGSGKTTTLAGMLNELNQTSKIHIVTLEDPIEFLHQHKKATFNQRELGSDFLDFPAGLRSALRQAPKIILVGEMRDRATVEIALTAAETGHLVLSTIHTISAGQSVNRILGMFDRSEEPQLRVRLSETLRWVVSQRLAPQVGGGRVLINEIMGSNLRVRETVALGEADGRNFYEIVEASAPFGWTTFDQSLHRAFQADLISEQTADLYATNKSKMTRFLDNVKKQRGLDQDKPTGLRLDLDAVASQSGNLRFS